MIDGVGKGALPRLPVFDAGASRGPLALPSGPGAGAASASAALTGRALVRDLAAAPPVDQARVAALRSAIAAGSYRPQPDAIAARMMARDRGSV